MSSGEHICIHLCGHIHVSSILESQDMCMFSFTNISLKGLLTWFSLIILPRLLYERYLLAKYSPISGILNQFHFSYSRGWILVLFIVSYFSVAKWTETLQLCFMWKMLKSLAISYGINCQFHTDSKELFRNSEKVAFCKKSDILTIVWVMSLVIS